MDRKYDELRQWIWNNRIPFPINVTLTEKQSFNGIKIDEIRSQQNFRHFKNVLNSKIFGVRYRRFGKQIKMLVVREGGVNKRYHLHCIIEKPITHTSEEFCNLLKQIWRNTDFGYEEIHIEHPSSKDREDGWLGYILKRRSKVNLFDSIDWDNVTIQR